jgi:hypothetical protein
LIESFELLLFISNGTAISAASVDSAGNKRSRRRHSVTQMEMLNAEESTPPSPKRSRVVTDLQEQQLQQLHDQWQQQMGEIRGQEQTVFAQVGTTFDDGDQLIMSFFFTLACMYKSMPKHLACESQ